MSPPPKVDLDGMAWADPDSDAGQRVMDVAVECLKLALRADIELGDTLAAPMVVAVFVRHLADIGIETEGIHRLVDDVLKARVTT